jgi:hypothetical protein
MNTNYRRAMASAIALMALAVSATLAAGDAAQEQQALAKALVPVSGTLQSGLAAAEAQGTPISAKFELDDQKQLQLSVYTMKGTAFSEVVVDYKTEKVAKTEPITEGEDLAAAKTQSAAISKAKVSLRAAIDAAVKGNVGFRAVRAVPALKAGAPIATIELLKGTTFKTVSEKLD